MSTNPPAVTLPEPWLRGPIAGVHPMSAPLLYSFTMVREDLTKWTAGMSTDELWARPMDLGPVGFHIRHIGGSSERLATYLKGEQLNESQMLEMKKEMEAGSSYDELFSRLEEQLLYVEAIVKALDPRTWNDARGVGRKSLPTTVGGLVTHIAEHAQRHVGEAIVTAKIVKGGTVLNR
jgi:hypothetical protein